MSDSILYKRGIRSYALRASRLTKGQAAAIASHGNQFLLPAEATAWSGFPYFQETTPLVLEIGFGNGDSLVQMAAENPNINYLGIEVHRPGVGHILQCIAASALENIKICEMDATIVLDQFIPDAALAGVQIFFPDPWHKKRHHKRRLVSPDFLKTLMPKLQPNAFVHIATDWADYADHVKTVFKDFPLFACNPSHENINRRPETKFERRGKKLGHEIEDIVYCYQPPSA